VAWALAPTDRIAVTGETRVYESSEHGRRHFCGQCGTGLFYTSEAVFPGMTDVQSATLDDPDALPLKVQIQTAERIGWMETAHRLPAFERYPGAPGD
jgi:hypothetical protein